MNASAPLLDETAIADLVDRFYARVRADDRLGPLFTEAIQDWDGHLQVMRDFWSAVLLRTARYRGCVMSPHFSLPITGEDFDRWLTLFRPSAAESLPNDEAQHAIAVAEAVTERLRRMATARQPG